MTCRKSKKDLAVYDWTLGDLTRLSAKYFWTWAKTNTMGYDGNDYLARDNCVNFDMELWFKLGNCMWRKHRSV